MDSHHHHIDQAQDTGLCPNKPLSIDNQTKVISALIRRDHPTMTKKVLKGGKGLEQDVSTDKKCTALHFSTTKNAAL